MQNLRKTICLFSCFTRLAERIKSPEISLQIFHRHHLHHKRNLINKDTISAPPACPSTALTSILVLEAFRSAVTYRTPGFFTASNLHEHHRVRDDGNLPLHDPTGAYRLIYQSLPSVPRSRQTPPDAICTPSACAHGMVIKVKIDMDPASTTPRLHIHSLQSKRHT